MHPRTAFQDSWFTIKLVGLTEVYQHSRTEKQFKHVWKRPRSPGGRCHHFRKFCEMMKQSKWKQGDNPRHPHLPANVWAEERTLLSQAERDKDVTSLDTEARPMSFSDSGSAMTSTLSVSLSSNRRFLPHRLYPASPNTLLYLKLSQDKNRGRLSSWRKHPRKTSPHGSERQRLNPQWDTLLYTTTTTTTTAGEDHREGWREPWKVKFWTAMVITFMKAQRLWLPAWVLGEPKFQHRWARCAPAPAPPHSLLGATSVW